MNTQCESSERNIIIVDRSADSVQKKVFCTATGKVLLHSEECVKAIESKTNHDVKAVEYFLKEKFKKHKKLD